MTHDELLEVINVYNDGKGDSFANALRAVVELTQKYEDFDKVDSEKMKGYRLAMKQVVQAIEKELNNG
jgi:hypothetical protein